MQHDNPIKSDEYFEKTMELLMTKIMTLTKSEQARLRTSTKHTILECVND